MTWKKQTAQSWPRSAKGRLVDQYAARLYKAEDVLEDYDYLEESLSLGETRAFVQEVTSSLWWLIFEIPDAMATARNIGPEFRPTPAFRMGWTGRFDRLVQIKPGRDCPWPKVFPRPTEVVALTDGRGSKSARAGPGNRIQMPRWSRRRRIILHEIAHLVATERPAHGPQFCRVFVEMVRFFGKNAGTCPAVELSRSLEKAGIPMAKKTGIGDWYEYEVGG